MPEKKYAFSELTNEVAEYASDLFYENTNDYLFFHNLKHTKFVVDKVREIGDHYSLSEKELFILTVAAWFHDTGQLFNYGKNHEMKSVSLMKDFFTNKIVEQSTIQVIEGCIIATRIPQQPKTFLEEIICDADTYNLGTINFLETDELLKKECEIKEDKKIDNWNTMTLKFLERHNYFTDYCRQLLNARKHNNINIVRQKLQTK